MPAAAPYALHPAAGAVAGAAAGHAGAAARRGQPHGSPATALLRCAGVAAAPLVSAQAAGCRCCLASVASSRCAEQQAPAHTMCRVTPAQRGIQGMVECVWRDRHTRRTLHRPYLAQAFSSLLQLWVAAATPSQQQRAHCLQPQPHAVVHSLNIPTTQMR